MSRPQSPFYALWATGLAVSIGLFTAGCSSSGQSRTPQPTPTETRSAAAVDSSLRAAANDWLGVSQEWGGTTQEGVDCSGLVYSIYDTEFQMSLPRTTDRQAQTGTKVSRSALQPGDLVFFRHNRKDYHVGIYLSDGEFLHTSSSEGVTITALDTPYWAERWWQGRRLLDLSGSSTDGTRVSEQTDPSSGGVGW